ncbi:hypothetical protein CAC42_5874 [Sphaceloma murrayae]|uniref:Uncharacterized protein n=1 Tax=Sphaceloma murrayae TaxID=2082308 RepID=A0A2K1QZE4_9PEZI|nr:hypothetical protein CAC42_5874 [Sphaceloma murrayae]
MATDMRERAPSRAEIQATLARLSDAAAEVASGPATWSEHVSLATRSLQTLAGAVSFESAATRQEQITCLEVLQNITYHDPDAGAVEAVAPWVYSQWLRLLAVDHGNVVVLHNVGLYWLWKTQPTLKHIHEQRQSSTSSEESSSDVLSGANHGAGDSARDGESQYGSPDHVEARALLHPAIEYLGKAVDRATERGFLSEDILSRAAEAHISIGTVTSPRQNEQHFRKAVMLLRTAKDKGFDLTPSLEQSVASSVDIRSTSNSNRYLQVYGRYIE